MKSDFGKPGPGANSNLKLSLMRSGSTRASKLGANGEPRKHRTRQEPSLPKLKFMEEEEETCDVELQKSLER